MSLYHTLKKAARKHITLFHDAVEAIAKEYRERQLTVTYSEIIDKLNRRPVDRAQWRRWYQANRKQQRQCTALRRRGVKVHPFDYNLRRSVVA